MAFFHYPTAVPVNPAMGYPVGVRMRGPNPSARRPDVSATVPSLITGGPHISRSGRDGSMLDHGSGWRNPYDHIGGENIDRQHRREKSCDQTLA